MHVSRNAAQAKKRLEEKKGLLEKIEHKFITDQISQEAYDRHCTKIHPEIDTFLEETDLHRYESSNLEKAVTQCLQMAQDQSGAWVSAGYEGKQQLQRLVFPDGMLFDKKKGVVRTPRVNSLFAAIPLLARVSGENENAIHQRIA
ncbi:MAG: hypothetical protein FJX89_08135 [Bacteroidetes bacterium]|nr:hypothetical protein [Bacteroidota bacterium]